MGCDDNLRPDSMVGRGWGWIGPHWAAGGSGEGYLVRVPLLHGANLSQAFEAAPESRNRAAVHDGVSGHTCRSLQAPPETGCYFKYIFWSGILWCTQNVLLICFFSEVFAAPSFD